MKKSRQLESIFAGTGSSGEHFILKVVTMLRISSSVDGLNIDRTSPLKLGVLELFVLFFGKEFLISAIFFLKNALNLFASSVEEVWLGNAVGLVLSISLFIIHAQNKH